jgi:hypothetical protein
MQRVRKLIALLVTCIALWAAAAPCAAAPHSKSHAKSKTEAHRRHRTGKHGQRAKAESEPRVPAERDTSLDELDTAPLVPEPEPRETEARMEPASVPEEPPPADEDTPDTAETSSEPTPNTRARVSFNVAGGVTYRSIEMTGVEGLRRLDTGWVPAVALEARAALGGERVWVEVGARYATSVHTFGSQQSPDPTSQFVSTPIRSHRFEGGVRPSVRFGADDASFGGGLFLGYGVRAFASAVELQMPRFTEHGPLARLELDIPVVGRLLRFRIAPEFQAILSISRAVRRFGQTEQFGIAFGGEASVRAQLIDWLALAIDYRESHAIVQSASAEPFGDIERFVLLTVGLRF